jgi:UDP-glucuronate decarboxylase
VIDYVKDIREPILAVPTQIYNLAGTPSPFKYLQDPIRTLETSTVGMLNVLRLAVQTGAKVLQASTGEVHEKGDHLDPRSCYRYGKMIAETFCADFSRVYGVDVKIARMFNSYGPGMGLSDGRVIPEFIKKALRNEDLVLFGGRQTRSFCYATDTVAALTSLMSSRISVPINICSPEEIEIGELAEFIVKECGSQSKVIYQPRWENDQDQINPTQFLAQQYLGWEPRVSLRDGLRNTINDFKRRMYVAEACEEDDFHPRRGQLGTGNNVNHIPVVEEICGQDRGGLSCH